MRKILIWFDRHIEEMILMILLSLMVIVVVVQVFMRYVMNNSLSWPEEITRYFFVWFTFIGMSYCISNNSNVKIDMIVNALPEKLQKVVLFIVDVFILLFFLYLGMHGLSALQKISISGQQSPALGIPMKYVFASLEAGIGLGIIRIIQSMIKRTGLLAGRSASNGTEEGGTI